MKLQFTKMHGAGNDFIVIDSTEAPFTMTTNQLRFIADRHLGIGADQILIVEKGADPGYGFPLSDLQSGRRRSGDVRQRCPLLRALRL